MNIKPQLFGKTLNELREIVSQLELPVYTAVQIADWIYQKEVVSFSEMTNISLNNRKKLEANFDLGLIAPSKVQISADGTKKYLFEAARFKYIEAAYIPEETRNTLCVSSQVGCKMGCLFCMTGKQGFQSNLTAGQILNQIRSIPERKSLSNIVYMGMGEPFDNMDEVMKSLEILTSDWGYGWSPKRITVSTIGIVPAIKRFISDSQCHLAISLHSPFEEERKKLMPIENVFSLNEVLTTLRGFDLNRQRRISFEYIMFKDLNDTQRHVNELARILNGIRCRINLIRFHPIPNTTLRGLDERTIEKFMIALNKKGIRTTIRASRGQDIWAACGLLSTKELVNKTQDN
ncbi:MAG TPA: 23S rRNA (adenine(2503)-C(2))-methyltransferase RlmN [Bacteroidales bacterium]|nr:23S rRNA (adenine(2503)-C(2))-methyltransferase RlmN [Bacteroidales bacterium]HQO07160.1 23S rRNA (adenine(2503)-C(2))-methyltransferase RlmN [Bacteroidales bacterium]HQP53860.1 23S rRNA (adenine(2503)-C(2))-methyltransferase RlmN [Bacteroidales bacterium]